MERQAWEWRYDGDYTPGLISVVLPSRRRPELLAKALYSLRETAVNTGLLEFWVAHDPDDLDTGAHALELGANAWQAPKRFGWHGNNIYFGHLFERAQGEWLIPWGDDILMQTPGWDEIVRASPRGVLHHKGGAANGHNTAPVVHRSFLRALPGFVPSPHQDTWLTDVAGMAGCLHHVNIWILEDRFDLTGNNRDETWEEGSVHQYRSAEYRSEPYLAERLADAELVKRAYR